MTYEELLIEADNDGILVKEAALLSGDGRCSGRRIAIRNSLPSIRKKADTLAEELGHFYTTVGDVTRLDSAEKRKQERMARIWAYNRQIGLLGLVGAFKHGCHGHAEVAEFLEVTEEFLKEAVECYRSKYGCCAEVDDYTIFFEPALAVMRKFDY